jgi:hypothetical protein
MAPTRPGAALDGYERAIARKRVFATTCAIGVRTFGKKSWAGKTPPMSSCVQVFRGGDLAV